MVAITGPTIGLIALGTCGGVGIIWGLCRLFPGLVSGIGEAVGDLAEGIGDACSDFGDSFDGGDD